VTEETGSSCSCSSVKTFEFVGFSMASRSNGEVDRTRRDGWGGGWEWTSRGRVDQASG
jgi:hypothetical protein